MLTATRQLAASVLALTIALPAAAAPKARSPKKPAPVAKPAPAAKPESEASPSPDASPAPDLKPAPVLKPDAEAKPAEAKAPEAKPAPQTTPAPAAKPTRTAFPAGVLDSPARAPEHFIHGHRYAYVAGGVLLLGGVGFGYFSRGEAKRAETLKTAHDAQAALSRARTAAATSNLLYGVAGLTIAYGLVLEVLPEPAADAASLTYHF